MADPPSDHDPPPPPSEADDPPIPPGTVVAKIYGDDPPRSGPFERSSVWTVSGPGGPVEHPVEGDTLGRLELRRVLRRLFAGSAPADDAPEEQEPRGGEILRIEWREHGETLAVSRLLADGTLLREQDGGRTVDRRLDREALAGVRAAMEEAGLGKAGGSSGR